jgi:hypothetical protein
MGKGKRETYAEIELIRAKITTGIRSLDNHLLPRHRAARERQLVTRAAPARLITACDRHRGVTVRERVRDGPWALVRAHVCGAAVAGGLGRRAGEHIVVCVAGVDGAGGEGGLAGPGAGGLAAVPVAGCAA